MTWLILGACVFVCWLIGRRWLRIIVACALLYVVGASVVVGYQEASAARQAQQ